MPELNAKAKKKQTEKKEFCMLDSLIRGQVDIETIVSFIARLSVIFLCFPIHECAHAWVANKLGDPTGKEKGRISLNPFKHLDWFGAISVIFLGFGYAKPVPVNVNNFKKPKLYFGLTALAGPVSNLIMAVILLLVYRILGYLPNYNGNIAYAIDLWIIYAAYTNISLAIFNLIPVPPLDGSRLVFAVLPDKAYAKMMKSGGTFAIILIVAIFICNRIGFSPLGIVTDFVFELMCEILI